MVPEILISSYQAICLLHTSHSSHHMFHHPITHNFQPTPTFFNHQLCIDVAFGSDINTIVTTKLWGISLNIYPIYPLKYPSFKAFIICDFSYLVVLSGMVSFSATLMASNLMITG